MDSTIPELAWLLLLIPTLVVLSYPAHAAWLFRRQRRALCPRGPWPGRRRISLVVPVRGVDEGLEANLESWLAQQLPAPWEVIVCVEDEDDPAVPIIRRAMAADRSGRLVLRITGAGSASLGKMHNLLSGLAAARGEVLVFVDSDARFADRSYLRRFIRPLADPAVGLVTCFPAYRGARSLGAALVGWAINNDMVGFMGVTGTWRRRLQLAVGTTLALRRETVEELGGLEVLRRQLLMDVTLARLVGELGLRVHLCEEPVGVHQRSCSLGAALQQANRWHIGMRRVLPAPLFALYLALRGALPAAAVGAALAGGGLPGALAGAFAVARIAGALLVNRRYVRDPSLVRFFWFIPAVDLLMCASAVAGLLRRSIRWRGRCYQIGPRGVAVMDEPLQEATR